MRPQIIIPWQIVRDIVAKTETKVLTELQAYDSKIQGINFQVGTVNEIANILTIMGKSSVKEGKKYPLFAFLTSVQENKGVKPGIDSSDDINLIIARRANNTDLTATRYENNIIPVLYPIYLEFLNQVYYDRRVLTLGQADQIPHQKIDFPYYDAPDKKGNIFNDYVDAIQLKFTKFQILTKNC